MLQRTNKTLFQCMDNTIDTILLLSPTGEYLTDGDYTTTVDLFRDCLRLEAAYISFHLPLVNHTFTVIDPLVGIVTPVVLTAGVLEGES